MKHRRILLNLLAGVAIALVFYASSRHDGLLFGLGFVLLVLSWTMYPLKRKAD